MNKTLWMQDYPIYSPYVVDFLSELGYTETQIHESDY